MSYDLTIWKWAADKRASPDDVFEALGNDEAHPAMQRFDAKSFVRALYNEFGGEELWSNDALDSPFLFEVADFTGTPANWIGVHIGYSRVNQVVPKLIALCKSHGLALFDHQTEHFHAGG